jgi:hypothetical protein
MLQAAVAPNMEGVVGDVMRTAGIPIDSIVGILRATHETRELRHVDRYWPQLGHVAAFSSVLLFLGVFSTWRRARTVEVAG